MRMRPANRTTARTDIYTLRSRAAGATLAVAVIAALAAVGCGDSTDPSEIVVSGYVESTEVRISTEVGGTLEWFPLREGDRIDEYQEIARVDTVDLRLELEEAEAERRDAAARLALLEAGSRKEEIAEAAAVVDQHRAELAAADRDLARMTGLLESGSGTEKAVDDARARRDATAARLEAARQRLRRLRAGSRDEEIEAARARLESAEARIARIRQTIRDATTVSPASGTVTAKLVEPGEIVAPAAALAVITVLDDPWLTVYVPEPDLGRIRLGQEAEVITDGGRRRVGRIVWISPRAEFTPKNVQTRDERVKLVYETRIGLDNDDGLFKPGMPAEARIPVVADDDGAREGSS